MLKREVERSDKEQQRSAAIVTEYKNICSQLSQRLDNERCQHLLAIENIKVNNIVYCIIVLVMTVIAIVMTDTLITLFRPMLHAHPS
jgi:hypothetical protein